MDSFFDGVDEELHQIFSFVSSPMSTIPLLQTPSSPSNKTFDPSSEQICSLVSSSMTVLPFFETPFSLPKKTLDPTLKAVDNRQQKLLTTQNPNENENRKIIHRDVERQRRQEMANLYSKVRSLLPQEYLKGKRSVSDHMNGAVNYIKYMQTKTRELEKKRDALKMPLKFSTINTMRQSSTHKQDLVMVRPSWTGGRIVVNTAITNNRLPLSILVRVLEADGIIINSCICSIAKHRSIYTMDCKVNWNRNMDLSELQMRLTNSVLSSLN